MKLKDFKIKDFDFWGGAKSTAATLNDSDFNMIEEFIEETNPDGLTSTELNDLFWFEEEYIATILGFGSWEDLEKSKNACKLINRLDELGLELRVTSDQHYAYVDESKLYPNTAKIIPAIERIFPDAHIPADLPILLKKWKAEALKVDFNKYFEGSPELQELSKELANLILELYYSLELI